MARTHRPPRRRRHPRRISQLPGRRVAQRIGPADPRAQPPCQPVRRPRADAERVATEIQAELDEIWDGYIDSIDILRPVFYRNKGAYLVGRLRWLNRVNPVILPVAVTSDGSVRVDAVLLTELSASRLFGYTRSYFHVLCRRPAAVVAFLKSLLPVKPVAELYTSIGYSAHGKTNLFRALYRHMEHSTAFRTSRGARGMVMAVFTLPSFDVVFKLIKDRFPPSKRTTPEDVQRRYKLVFDRDKVGRLVDAQEFTNLSFDRDRFDEDLIEELSRLPAQRDRHRGRGDPSSRLHRTAALPARPVSARDGTGSGREAAVDYGNAIKDLASANIFPGDLFPKNFGVSRHGVVVFYDYDELALCRRSTSARCR